MVVVVVVVVVVAALAGPAGGTPCWGRTVDSV